jgi:hypothetical protein
VVAVVAIFFAVASSVGDGWEIVYYYCHKLCCLLLIIPLSSFFDVKIKGRLAQHATSCYGQLYELRIERFKMANAHFGSASTFYSA